MKFIINKYRIMSWFIKSLALILIVAILKLVTSIPIPSRPLGVPILYYPAFIIAVYSLIKLKIPKAIKKEVVVYSLFWLIAVFTSCIKIISVSSFILFSGMYLLYIVLFISGIKLTKEQVINLIHQFIKIMVFGCLISICLFVLGQLKDPNIFGVFGINRNNFVFLVTIACMMQIFFSIIKPNKKNICWAIIFIVNVIFLISRTAYIAIIFSVILFIISQISRKRTSENNNKIFNRLKKGLIIGLILIIGMFFTSNTFQSRISGLSEIVYILGAKKLTNHELGGRRQLLMLAHLKLFLNNPIIGVGIGQSNERLDKNKIGTSVGSAHNTQIRTLAENGIIGFILLSIFYWMVWSRLRRNCQFDQYSLGFYYGYISLLILSFGNEYFITNPMVWVFISLGYSYSLNISYEKNINY
jgi:hypothetical protein